MTILGLGGELARMATTGGKRVPNVYHNIIDREMFLAIKSDKQRNSGDTQVIHKTFFCDTHVKYKYCCCAHNFCIIKRKKNSY